MDVFWVIPFGLVVIPLLCLFAVRIMRHPESPSKPDVLLDKPSDQPATDEAATTRDWSARPCGAYLEWRAEHHKS